MHYLFRLRCLDGSPERFYVSEQFTVAHNRLADVRRQQGAVNMLDAPESCNGDFFHVVEIGECFVLGQLSGRFGKRQSGKRDTARHDKSHRKTVRTIKAIMLFGKAFSLSQNDLPYCGCDISAEAFVAPEAQRADAVGNAEDGFFVRGFHAPMHCIGEEHVPEMSFGLDTKKRFQLYLGSAMHAIG